MDPVTKRSGNCMVVARAATAIYLILSTVELRGRQVVVPANLCYAGIFPIQYAGLEPAFCDVDPISGNVTCRSVSAALTSQTGAMIVPHMYGNPVGDMPRIAELCRREGIVLIEDCASAMGAQAPDYLPGTMGDFTVYSMGYSKTLDLGYGGLLVNRAEELSGLEELERGLPEYTEEAGRNLRFFSKLYRLMRNEGGDLPITRMIYSGLPECCRLGFVHRLKEQKKQTVSEAVKELGDVVGRRRSALCDYAERLAALKSGTLYPYSPGAVPWRLNLLVEDHELRKTLIEECLDRRLPVSDWYPKVTPVFGCRDAFPGAELHERRILNFPLLIEREKKDGICEVLLKYLS